MVGFNSKNAPLAIPSVAIEERKSEGIANKIFSRTTLLIAGISLTLLMILGVIHFSDSVIVSSADDSTFDDQGRYIMRDFDLVKPMANFLNGIAGEWGVPMWAFFLNRGQGKEVFLIYRIRIYLVPQQFVHLVNKTKME